MPIIFENIDTGESVAYSRKKDGTHYAAKLSAVVNLSNMHINADRLGQDFGWRLQPEQQALIEQWEQDPIMVDKVSQWSQTMVDSLTHAEFLAYLAYQQELGTAPERTLTASRREAQMEYEARVQKLKDAATVEAMAPFKNPTVGIDPAEVGGDKTVEAKPKSTPKK